MSVSRKSAFRSRVSLFRLCHSSGISLTSTRLTFTESVFAAPVRNRAFAASSTHALRDAGTSSGRGSVFAVPLAPVLYAANTCSSTKRCAPRVSRSNG